MDKLVSIIVPAYNAAWCIRRCLDSCVAQTYSNIEVLVIDDGSVDETAAIASQYTLRIGGLKVVSRSNSGQGAVRNFALRELAAGDYILFLDADDYLLDRAVEILVGVAEADSAEVTICDYQFFNEERRAFYYNDKSSLLAGGEIGVEEIKSLLRVPYFTVNKLYRADFLRQNEIVFGEGYLYEDNEFYVGVLLRARRISSVAHPLYVVSVNDRSSTKTNFDNDRHAVSYLKAVTRIVERYGAEIKDANFSAAFCSYVLNRAYLYTFGVGRIPKRYWSEFIFSIFDILHEELLREARNKVGYKNSISYNVWLKSQHPRLTALVFIALGRAARSSRIRSAFKKARAWLWRFKKKRKSKKLDRFRRYLNSLPVSNKKVLFHGFDGEVRGNTKYLLNQMLSSELDLCVAVKEVAEGAPYKQVVAGTYDYYREAALAGVHVLETWADPSIVKRAGSVWIQLWHGTPIKKILFDSVERDVVSRNPRHKLSKFNDVRKWDYLLCQNEYSALKFSSSFCVNRDKMLKLGYPRTDFFKSANQESIKESFIVKYLLDPSKRILIYAPTWRDYNGRGKISCHSYLVDFSAIPRVFDEFNVVYIGHPFGRAQLPRGVVGAVDDDVQEWLVAADVLVTDYSSILFDWLELEKPFCLSFKDKELYEYTRGIYSDFQEEFSESMFFHEDDFWRSLDSASFTFSAKYRPFKSGCSAQALVEFIKGVASK